MEPFFDQLTSPGWWISVVVVGILINLAAAYLKPVVDSVLGRLSKQRAARLAEQRDNQALWVKYLFRNPHGQTQALLGTVLDRVHGIQVCVLGTFCLLFASVSRAIPYLSSSIWLPITLAFVGAFLLALGQVYYMKPARILKALSETSRYEQEFPFPCPEEELPPELQADDEGIRRTRVQP
jgi:hypothetical protein